MSLKFFMLLSLQGIFGQFERNLEYTIQENQPSGIQVGLVSSDMIHLEKIKEPKYFDSSYTFVLRDKNDYFNLDPKTSVLKTGNTIDLEMLCPKYCTDKGTGFINLVVNVWKVNQLCGVIRVKVVVIDQNDNAPIFPMKTFEKKIKEVLYGVGKVIELPKAIDKDVTYENNKVLYKLSEPSETFQLQITNDSNPRLVLKKDIDFENEIKYSLNLIAWNPKSPTLTSNLEIKIDVIDINDCEPIFSHTLMELKIDENSKVGKLITKLKATDKDKDSKLTYGMIAATKQINRDTFMVKESGEVMLMKELDVETQNEYDLQIFATDGEFTTYGKLKVVVQDVNNHPPIYNLNPASISIEENQPPQILVGQVTVSDVDSVEVNGNIRCKEPQGKSNQQALEFKPDPADNPTILKYEMYSRISFDREEASLELVHLICEDGGLIERLTSTLTISLYIVDVNDNAPEFPQKLYSAEINENNAIGDKVIQVKAIDKDYKENGATVYSIVNGKNSNMFFIDENTGLVNVMRELDREECDNFQLVILAKNKPPIHMFSATTTVNIKVIDQNDNHPQLKPPTQFTLTENEKSNIFIGQINAVDKDFGKNGQMIFKLLSTKYERLFEIKQNGSVYSRASFDRENQERYCLNIRVSDTGIPQPLSNTGTICILILDTNDNKPTITMISTPTESSDQISNNTSVLHEVKTIVTSVHEAAGQRIATVSAEDKDKDENSQITFLLESDNNDPNSVGPPFMIDENDGHIKISRVMSRDNIGEYKIKIIAHDKGKPILKTEKVIIIKVLDIPSQMTNVETSSIQVTGNVVIVIILSIISAFLTALLIGAILCMIRPCCQSEPYTSDFQQDSQNNNAQTLLQKLPPSYYNVNPYGQCESYEPWVQTLNRNGPSYGNPTLDLHTNNSLDKVDYFKYETPQMYMSTNTLCPVNHLIGKPNGCACGQGRCLRYSTHNNTNCLFSNPEEQFSDSGRGASDDDQKALNINQNLTTSSRQLSSMQGTYMIGDVSKSKWKDSFQTQSPNERLETYNEQINAFDQCNDEFMASTSFNVLPKTPMTTFQSSYKFETNQCSNVNSDSYDSLSNFQKLSSNVLSSNVQSVSNSETFPTHQRSSSIVN